MDDKIYKTFNKILISGFKTSHNEIGPKNRPMAIVIKFERKDYFTDKLIILGDTEYKNSFIDKMDHNLKVLVLHIGSAQFKENTGKHLYLIGTKKLLNDLDSKLSSIGYRGKLLVLISEWGLEHATREQLGALCVCKIPKNIKNGSTIINTLKYLQEGLSHINILVADVGLMVDIIDQKIYIGDSKYSFEEIHCYQDIDGIKYSHK